MPEKRSVPFNSVASVKNDGSLVISLKGIAIIVALLGVGTGGGSLLANWGLASADDVDELRQVEVERAEEDDARHDAAVKRLDGHDEQLQGITAKIGEVQDVQHWQAADQAAERVSQQAPKSRQRDVYRRLFQQNMTRLRAKKMPCSDLDCTN